MIDSTLAISQGLMVTLQVGVSLLMVAVVIWGMWKLAPAGDNLLTWGPPLALLSPWVGLASVAASIILWFVDQPDTWLPPIFLVLYPAALASGVLVLWLYRDRDELGEPVALQRTQARVGIALGLIGVAVGYVFVMTSKTPFTMIGE